MAYYVGIDGGGTRTTVGIADESGTELLRRIGPAGLVDAKRPSATVDLLVTLVRDAAGAAGLELPATALCAGLAGVGNATERELVQEALERSGVADRVVVISDGEAALDGALGGGPGILLIAGTGSVAYGRSEDGRVEHCGGWGMILGDEGSGYRIGQAGLSAALLYADGRGAETKLLPGLMEALGLAIPDAIPPWAARAEKSEIALLAVHVLRLADRGDRVAREIVMEAALDLGAHVGALVERLGPWTSTPAVVLHGGVALDPVFSVHVARVLRSCTTPVRLVASRADAVTGALEHARGL
ncbi:MAG: BadF/BadG/BcrA/BcrD ATPase family protein [Gemmatimonadota bacterium]